MIRLLVLMALAFVAGMIAQRNLSINACEAATGAWENGICLGAEHE